MRVYRKPNHTPPPPNMQLPRDGTCVCCSSLYEPLVLEWVQACTVQSRTLSFAVVCPGQAQAQWFCREPQWGSALWLCTSSGSVD